VVNESLLELWDYFLLSGWKAITKLGLFMLTSERDQLIGMSFEEVLGFIPQVPSKVLIKDGHNGLTVY